MAAQTFQGLRKMLDEEHQFDNQKRNQYREKWNRPPSNIVNKSMFDQIDSKQFFI